MPGKWKQMEQGWRWFTMGFSACPMYLGGDFIILWDSYFRMHFSRKGVSKWFAGRYGSVWHGIMLRIFPSRPPPVLSTRSLLKIIVNHWRLSLSTFPEKSRNLPGNFLGFSKNFPGHFPDIFRTFPDNCRTFLGHFINISRIFPRIS